MNTEDVFKRAQKMVEEFSEHLEGGDVYMCVCVCVCVYTLQLLHLHHRGGPLYSVVRVVRAAPPPSGWEDSAAHGAGVNL